MLAGSVERAARKWVTGFSRAAHSNILESITFTLLDLIRLRSIVIYPEAAAASGGIDNRRRRNAGMPGGWVALHNGRMT